LNLGVVCNKGNAAGPLLFLTEAALRKKKFTQAQKEKKSANAFLLGK